MKNIQAFLPPLWKKMNVPSFKYLLSKYGTKYYILYIGETVV